MCVIYSSQNFSDETRLSKTSLNDGVVMPVPRTKKSPLSAPQSFSFGSVTAATAAAAAAAGSIPVSSNSSISIRAPMPPPRRLNSQQRFVSLNFLIMIAIFLLFIQL